MRRRRTARRAAETLLLALLAACAPHAPRPEPLPPSPGETAATVPVPGAAGASRAAELRVVDLARSVLHAPYRSSGSDRRGFDCSGLTAWVYGRSGTALPRTTSEQAHEGRWVALDELRPGDLVFFGRSRRSLSHVGIVVSEPQEPLTMIHASSSQGVVQTVVLDSPYWLSRLQLGRRVLAG
ncbi:MAG: C40 family peptidase [Thermoanaerobaculia bacterium]